MQLIQSCTMLVFLVLWLSTIKAPITKRVNAVLNDQRQITWLFPRRYVMVTFAAILIVVYTYKYGFVDTASYRSMYAAVRTYSWTDMRTNPNGVEVGWLLFLRLLNLISTDSKLMLFVGGSIIICGFLYTINRYSVDVSFSMIIFYFTMFLDLNNGMRQYVATAFIVLGFQFVIQRRFLPYLLMVIIASFCHNSAIFCLLFYFLANGKVFNKKIVISIGISLVFMIIPSLFTGILTIIFSGTNYSYYISAGSGMRVWRLLVSIVPSIMVLLISCRINHKDIAMTVSDSVFANLILINTIFCVLGLRSWIFVRMCFYTGLIVALFIPQLIKLLFREKDTRIVKVLAFTSYFIFFCYNLHVNNIYGNMHDFYLAW